MWSQIILAIVVTSFFLIGLSGIILPVLPGIFFIVLGIIIYAVATQFTVITGGVLTTYLIIGALAWGLEFLAGTIGSKLAGGSKLAAIMGVLGLLVGLSGNLPGMLLGAFIGAFIGALIEGKSASLAAKVAGITLVSLAAGKAIQLVIALGMIVSFAWIVLI